VHRSSLLAAWTCLAAACGPGGRHVQDPDAIIGRHITAIGGAEALATIHAMRYVRTVQNTESGETRVQSTAVMLARRPRFYRTEHPQAGSFYVSDGTRAWRGRRETDADSVTWEALPTALPPPEVDFDRMFGPFIDYERKGYVASYTGSTGLDGKELETVLVRWSDGGSWEFYFDPATGLWYGYDASPGGPGGLVRVDDYRRVGTILLPHRNVVTDTLPSGDTRIHERLYSSFELNPLLPEHLFRPGGAPAPEDVRTGNGSSRSS